jgi:hypothetical protein
MEVLKMPIEKEKSSDETKQVPNMPVMFNSMCAILRYSPAEHGRSLPEYERVSEEVASTIAIIA